MRSGTEYKKRIAKLLIKLSAIFRFPNNDNANLFPSYLPGLFRIYVIKSRKTVIKK